jgi:hypothetical protein
MMAAANWREVLPARVRGMQIIVVALVLGCLFFAVVSLIMSNKLEAKNESNLITVIALGVVVLTIVPRVVAPAIMVSAGRKKILGGIREKSAEQESGARASSFDVSENAVGQQLIALLQGKLVISAALIEGPTFFLLVAYMLERSPIALAAAGILMVILALHFPTLDRASNWIEDQLRLLKEEC